MLQSALPQASPYTALAILHSCCVRDACQVREPRLLAIGTSDITRRLMDMRIAQGLENTNVLQLVVAQPSLLLQPDLRVSREETSAERLQVGRSPLRAFLFLSVVWLLVSIHVCTVCG